VNAWKDDTVVAAVLADHRTAPVDERLRATLGFLEKLTLHPDELGPEDVALVRAAGASDRAIEEAIYVAFLFNVMDRLADAFDFAMPSAGDLQMTVRMLTRIGYGIASIPG
jgi:alkylhydroperoxidase family enzyme